MGSVGDSGYACMHKLLRVGLWVVKEGPVCSKLVLFFVLVPRVDAFVFDRGSRLHFFMYSGAVRDVPRDSALFEAGASEVETGATRARVSFE